MARNKLYELKEDIFCTRVVCAVNVSDLEILNKGMIKAKHLHLSMGMIKTRRSDLCNKAWGWSKMSILICEIMGMLKTRHSCM